MRRTSLSKALTITWGLRGLSAFLIVLILVQFMHAPLWAGIALVTFYLLQIVPLGMWTSARAIKHEFLIETPTGVSPETSHRARHIKTLMVLAVVAMISLLVVIYLDVRGTISSGWGYIVVAVIFFSVSLLVLWTVFRTPMSTRLSNVDSASSPLSHLGEVSTGGIMLILLPAQASLLAGGLFFGAGILASVMLKTPIYVLIGAACYALFLLMGRSALRSAIAKLGLE